MLYVLLVLDRRLLSKTKCLGIFFIFFFHEKITSTIAGINVDVLKPKIHISLRARMFIIITVQQ